MGGVGRGQGPCSPELPDHTHWLHLHTSVCSLRPTVQFLPNLYTLGLKKLTSAVRSGIYPWHRRE